MSLAQCRVVLVQTHYPGNLGAAARAMANMGLADLVLVAPHADPGAPEARQLATHGLPILERARIVPDFLDAVADCVIVAATSASTGSICRRQTVAPPAYVAQHLVEALRQDRPAALVFGPEPTGLSNDIITRCHQLIRIPTCEEHPSLNLAQAAAICLYELRQAWDAPAPLHAQAGDELADHASQEHLFQQLRAALEEIHYLYGPKADSLMHAVRHLLGRARLTRMEVQLLLGLARQMRWAAGKREERADQP